MNQKMSTHQKQSQVEATCYRANGFHQTWHCSKLCNFYAGTFFSNFTLLCSPYLFSVKQNIIQLSQSKFLPQTVFQCINFLSIFIDFPLQIAWYNAFKFNPRFFVHTKIVEGTNNLLKNLTYNHPKNVHDEIQDETSQ